MRGATADEHLRHLLLDVSIRAPREGGDANMPDDPGVDDVSIRAPREGGDGGGGDGLNLYTVSIRAPREGGDSKPDR